MGNGSRGSLEQNVDRADFFRWGSKNIKRLAGEFVSSTLEAMKVEDSVGGWNKLANENVIGARPRLYFTKGQPFFVVGGEDKQPAVISGTCAEDGGLLEWRDNLGKFCCPFCRSTYDRSGKADGSTKIFLKRPETKVMGGFVMVRTTN